MDVDNINERKVIVKNGFNITYFSTLKRHSMFKKVAKYAYIVT